MSAMSGVPERVDTIAPELWALLSQKRTQLAELRVALAHIEGFIEEHYDITPNVDVVTPNGTILRAGDAIQSAPATDAPS